MNPLDFVRTIPPFDQLTPNELSRVVQHLEEVTFEKDVVILQPEGEASHYLYLILAGAVRLEREQQTVMMLEEGDLFGFPSMLAGSSPALTVIADEPTQVYALPESIFRSLLDNTAFAEFFLSSLGKRLRQTTQVEVPFGGNLLGMVGTLLHRPPVFVAESITVAEAARVMRESAISSVLVESEPPGIFTDRDLRSRVVAEELPYGTPIRQVMTPHLHTLPTHALVYHALLFMLEHNIHHLPLTQEGKIAGLVSTRDLLRHQTNSPFYLLTQINRLDDLTDLSFYAPEVAKVVSSLRQGGLEVVQIGHIVSNLNDTLLARIIKLVEQELGTPPVPYAWIVFGSEGRMEQTLLTDQDNALIYEKKVPGAEPYFKALAEQVGEALLRAGFPPCPGGYMAKNWCRPLADWERLFEHWVISPEPQALLEASIFFDFRSVYGTLSLESLEKLLLKGGKNDLFLGHLARATLQLRPPLGFFKRIREENGHVDLKKGGIAPIVGLARLYALEAHSRARSTLERIQAAARQKTLSQDGADTLSETFRFLLGLRLRDQLTDLREGRRPDNRVRMREQLSSMERRHLKDAFIAISALQSSTAQRYHTAMLG